MYIIKEYVISG